MDEVVSPSWEGAIPEIAVVISSYNRAHLLPGLFESLEAQTLGRDRFEVVLVDNGSADDTMAQLAKLVAVTPLRAKAVRNEHNRGPGGGRNAGAEASRAPLLAITDDDCLPTPVWVEGVLAVLQGGADVVQGPIRPDPAGLPGRGPWDHLIHIEGATPWFETSNVAYRRSMFEAVGGFDEADELTARHGGGRAFGEDAVLGSKVVDLGGVRAWAADAPVLHRVLPGTYRRQFSEWRQLKGFPGLVERCSVGQESLYRGIFLNRGTAETDLAVIGVLVAVATRRPWTLALVYPWAKTKLPLARFRARDGGKAEVALRLAQQGVIEAVGFFSLIEGSIRHRRLVL